MQSKTALRVLLAVSLFVFTCLLADPFSFHNKYGFKKIPKMDRIDLAIQQEFELTKDPSLNEVPRDRLLEAALVRDEKLPSVNGQRAIAGLGWQERGPNNIGGRTRALHYDLNDAANGYRKVWAGSVSGGLWYTNDITASNTVWHRVDDLLGNLAVTTIAQNPANPQELYAGTGEGWFNSDAVRGLGIWKSSDGGNSWAQLGYTNVPNFHYVQKIVVTSAGTILAATRNNGVQRSTDGGASFNIVMGAGNRAADLEIASDGRIYATLGIFSTAGIYRSSDDGASWTSIYTPAADERRVEIACAPSNANRIYALIHDNDNNGIKNIKSTSNATAGTPTWTNLTSPTWCDQGSSSADFTRGQAWYDLIAAVDPTDANIVYIGGVDVLKSTDGGSSWTQITQWAQGCGPSYVHADIHDIKFRPGMNSDIIVGTDGGIFRTTDGGTSFVNRNSGYNVTQYYGCAMHPSNANYFLAGAQDNGTQNFTAAGLNTSATVTGGDGAIPHIDQSDGNVQITSYVYNNYWVSTDGGVSFITRFLNDNGSFINPTDFDNSSKILYGGATNGSYFRWEDPSAAIPVTSFVNVQEFGPTQVSHVAVSPITANRVYFGLNNGNVVVVDGANAGNSHVGVTIFDGLSQGGGSVSCIAIDPADEDHMLITRSNYGLTSVYESTNATSATPTWTSVEGDLPDMPVRWAMFDPRNSDWAILATELGIWTTDNLNAASTEWNPANAGLANVRVDMLQYNASTRTILAATHGRGLFTAIVPLVITPSVKFVRASQTNAEQFSLRTGCSSYKDYVVWMTIDDAPSGTATINVNLQGGGTATQGVDFDYNTNGDFSAPSTSFSFVDAETSAKPVYLRVYDDGSVEGNETFTLNYSITPGAHNVVTGSTNQTHAFTITDNDLAPSGATTVNASIGTNNTSLNMPFGGGMQDGRTQMVYLASELVAAGFSAGTINSIAFNVVSKGSSAPYNNFTIKMKLSGVSSYYGTVFETGASTVYGPVAYSTVSGTNTINLTTPFVWDGSANIVVDICFDNASATGDDLVAGTSATPRTQFRRGTGSGCAYSSANSIYSGGGARPVLTFSITKAQTTVATALNTSRSENLDGNTDVYYYSSTGELIARLRNLSSHDYGCTQVTIDRAGTASSQFWNNVPANYLMNKTFKVLPATDNASGQVEFTLYFTQAEVAGWEAATSQSFNSIQLVKLPSQVSNVTPANPEPDGPGSVQVVINPTRGTIGTHRTLTFTFNTGMGALGAGIPGAFTTLPVTLLNFTGKLQKEHVLLEWTTVTEQNNRGFEIEKSYDGITFRKIGFVQSAGNSSTLRRYNYPDKEKASEFNYYRLRIVDLDNTHKLSEIVLVKNPNTQQEIFVINNPFLDRLSVRFAKAPKGKVSVELFDMQGRKILHSEYARYDQHILEVGTGNRYLGSGVYVLRIELEERVYSVKVVKK